MRAFISYSHSDSATADRLCEILDRAGLKYFRDVKDVEWGGSILGSVRQGLDLSRLLLVVVSPRSLKSQWVPFEIGYATALGKRILPFLAHPQVDPPPYIRDLAHISRLEDVEPSISRMACDAAEGRIAAAELTSTERLALEILSKAGCVEIGSLSTRLLKTLAETDEMMNRLKRVDLVTARYTDKGKYWELDFDGSRLMQGSTDLYPMEKTILNG